MKNTEDIQVIEQRVVSITCDRCETKIDADDIYEFQEIVSIKIEAGYGSIFGDGNIYELDVCQKCVKETLGEHMRLTGNYIWGGDPKVIAGAALQSIADQIEQSQHDNSL